MVGIRIIGKGAERRQRYQPRWARRLIPTPSALAIHPPIPPTRPPQEKADVLQHEPTNGEEGGRSGGEEDGEAESLGCGVGGKAGNGGGELFGGVRFPCDVAEEDGIVITAEFARIHFSVGAGYGDCGCEEGREEGDVEEVGSLFERCEEEKDGLDNRLGNGFKTDFNDPGDE